MENVLPRRLFQDCWGKYLIYIIYNLYNKISNELGVKVTRDATIFVP